MARIEESIEVNVPVRIAYDQMTQFEQYPRFMQGVKSIRQIDDTHLHWHTQNNGTDHEWDSEITEQLPNKLIAWRNISGKQNTGKVTFEPLGANKTRITVSMEIHPEGTPLQAQEIDNVVAVHTGQDLQRFKQMIESQGHETGAWRGEIHHGETVSDGKKPQSAAQRSKPLQQGASAGNQESNQTSSAGRQGTQQPGGQQYGNAWLPRVAGLWEEPFVMMRRMTEEMDHFIDNFISGPLAGAWPQRGRDWSPQVEVRRQDNQIVVYADLPGIKKEDVHIEVTPDRLKIEGERHADNMQQSPDYRRTERVYGHFYREIPLPDGVDPQAANASMHDGVLEIHLPVASEQQRTRRIDVQSRQ